MRPRRESYYDQSSILQFQANQKRLAAVLARIWSRVIWGFLILARTGVHRTHGGFGRSVAGG